MIELSEQQVAQISAYIRKHGVAQHSLHDDLLDHVCTSIERSMDRGKAFEEAFDETIRLFGPGGFKQVQQQTFELLTEMNETMKKVTFSFGLTSTILLLAGTIFKIMHWPGAGVMMVLGAGILVLAYLPMLLWHKLRESPSDERLMHLSGFVGLSLTTLGVLFKIMHWPGAGMMLVLGMSTLALLYVPVYFYKKYQTSANKPVTLSTSLVAMTCLILVFALMNMKNSSQFDRNSVQINLQLDQSNARLKQANASLRTRVEDDNGALSLIEATDRNHQLLEDVKLHLVAEAQEIPEEQAKALTAIDLRDKNNLGTPVHVLWESGDGSAHSMKSIVASLREFRKEMLEAMPESMREDAQLWLPFSWAEEEGSAMDWAREHFYRVQLSVVLAQMTQLQIELQQAESQALLYILSQPEASDPPSGS